MPEPLVLLADDDQDMTAVLAQRLRADGFRVVTAGDGLKALQAMEAEPPHVAFLDLNMPGLDGIALCERVRQAPWGRSIPLILLTSSGQESTAGRALRAGATGYLLKPPRYEALRSEVWRHVRQGELPAAAPEGPISPKLGDLLETVGQLPAMPIITHKLLEVLNNPSAGAKELGRVVSMDPAVTAQVLRLANSAYYGQPGKVTDVTKAVILVGFSEISHTLMSLSLANIFATQGAEILPRIPFWEHAVACSAMATQLAKRAGHLEPHRAQVAGLLHDLGKLVLACYLPEDYAAILADARMNRRHTRESERALLGDHHALLGEALSRRWGLPQVIGRSVRYHHAPLSAENLDHDTLALVRFVCAADTLAKAGAIGSAGDDMVEEIPERIWQLLSVDQKAAEGLILLARRTVAMQKTALGSAPAPDPAQRPPVLLVMEGNQSVSLSSFAVEAAGFAPRIVLSWGDGIQALSGDAGIRIVLLDSSVSPRDSRFLETVLRWRGGRTDPRVIFAGPEKKMEGGGPAGVRLLPKPMTHTALRAALAGI